jgi:ABC-type microcin C transport system permease subunit YejE
MSLFATTMANFSNNKFVTLTGPENYDIWTEMMPILLRLHNAWHFPMLTTVPVSLSTLASAGKYDEKTVYQLYRQTALAEQLASSSDETLGKTRSETDKLKSKVDHTSTTSPALSVTASDLEWFDADLKAKDLLKLHIHPNLYPLINSCTTASTILTEIQKL